MSIKRFIFEVRREIRWAGYGALFFWLPDVLIHAIARQHFDTHQVWLVTVLCPLSLLVGYFVIARFSARKISGLNSGLMILGVWCAGGFATMVASSFAGGGFVAVDGWWTAVGLSLVVVIFPPFTAMLATYDGTLFALLLGTLLMSVEAATLSARMAQSRLTRVAG